MCIQYKLDHFCRDYFYQFKFQTLVRHTLLVVLLLLLQECANVLSSSSSNNNNIPNGTAKQLHTPQQLLLLLQFLSVERHARIYPIQLPRISPVRPPTIVQPSGYPESLRSSNLHGSTFLFLFFAQYFVPHTRTRCTGSENIDFMFTPLYTAFCSCSFARSLSLPLRGRIAGPLPP